MENERSIESRISILKNELKHAIFDIAMFAISFSIGLTALYRGDKIYGAFLMMVGIGFFISFYRWLLH